MTIITIIKILTILAGIIIYVASVFAWKVYKRKQRNIEYQKQLKEHVHYLWLSLMGLQETKYYFNGEGLRTLTLQKPWDTKI